MSSGSQMYLERHAYQRSLPNSRESLCLSPDVSRSQKAVTKLDFQSRGQPQSSDAGKRLRPSESFRTVPNGAEALGTSPNVTERKASHTLTVREAARMFELAGVARTERSIVNWCQFNAQGVARLDAYFDPNEHKYFITPQSVEQAIAEEEARAAKVNTVSEAVGRVPNGSEAGGNGPAAHSEDGGGRVAELAKEVLDLKILNSGKDFLIGQLKEERDGFFSQLLESSRKVGEMEAKLLQLEEHSTSERESK